MDKNTLTTWVVIIVVIIVAAGLFWLVVSSNANRVTGALTLQQLSERSGCQLSEPQDLEGFAKCLKDSGAIFYGASWCPHCQEQKALFGNSAQYLPYVECSTPDGNGQLAACANQRVQVYPTWQFK